MKGADAEMQCNRKEPRINKDESMWLKFLRKSEWESNIEAVKDIQKLTKINIVMLIIAILLIISNFI